MLTLTKMNNKSRITHNDLTVLKHYEIYKCYEDLCKQIREKYPEVADFIARQYYYDILSTKFNLTPNYICTIICKTMNNESGVKSDLMRACLNIQSDNQPNY